MANSGLFVVIDGCGWVILLICCAFAIHGHYLLWQHRHSVFIKKRSLMISYGVSFAWLMQMIALQISAGIHSYVGVKAAIYSYLYVVVSMYTLLFFWNTKAWLIWYRNKWTYYTLKHEWQPLIDTSLTQRTQNWFIRNNAKYGNTAYVSRIFGAFHLIAMILAIIRIVGGQNFDDNWFIRIGFLYLPMSMSVLLLLAKIVLVHRLKVTDDALYIRYEMNRHAIILILMLSLLIVRVIINATLYDGTMHFAAYAPFLVLLCYAMIYVSTYGILKKWNQSNGHESQIQLVRHALYGTLKVDDILRNKMAVHLFMVHLSKEFSMEVLLSYIEFVQYAVYLKTHSSATLEDPVAVIAENLPKSSIIQQISESDKHDEDELQKAKRIGHELYSKYLLNGCELEINVSFGLRNRCRVLRNLEWLQNHQQISMPDLFVLAQAVIDEMYLLLTYALRRFKNADEFEKIVQVFDATQQT